MKIGDQVHVHDFHKDSAGKFSEGRTYFGEVINTSPSRGTEVRLRAGGTIWVKSTARDAWKHGAMSVTKAKPLSAPEAATRTNAARRELRTDPVLLAYQEKAEKKGGRVVVDLFKMAYEGQRDRGWKPQQSFENAVASLVGSVERDRLPHWEFVGGPEVGHPKAGKLKTRLYHVVVVNDRTGKMTRMTSTPVTHAEGTTFLSKMTHYAGRRERLEDAAVAERNDPLTEQDHQNRAAHKRARAAAGHPKGHPKAGKPGVHKCAHCKEIIEQQPVSFHTGGKTKHYHPHHAKHHKAS